MKNFFGRLCGMMAVAIGWLFGKWLWDEVLKEKFDKLKAKLSRKD